jgi:ceramide glucosyltransferase
MIIHTLLVCALAGLLSSIIYLVLVMVGARRFCSARGKAVIADGREAQLPAASVLKPVHGMEPLLNESLESFFLQDYPSFELIFGARSEDDPALDVVRALRQKRPGIRTKILVAGEPACPNAKIHALARMVAAASHPYVVISDSDVRVKSGWLGQVIRPLLDPGVGLVTCIYRGVPTGGLWSLLEALGMSVEMSSGVLVADLLEGMQFALGPTMATRKDVLREIGGIEVLGSYHSDDFELGHLVHEAGRKVVLSHHIVDHVVLNRSARGSILHQLRWLKSARFSRPKGHLGTGLTFAMPFGLLGMVAGLAGGSWVLATTLLGIALLKSIMQSVAVGYFVVRDPRSLRFCWLYPARELLGFCLWGASYVGNEFVWRGERYRLEADGKITRQTPPAISPRKREDAPARSSSSTSVSIDDLP